MAADEEREAQPDEWGEEMMVDLADAPRRKDRTRRGEVSGMALDPSVGGRLRKD